MKNEADVGAFIPRHSGLGAAHVLSSSSLVPSGELCLPRREFAYIWVGTYIYEYEVQ